MRIRNASKRATMQVKVRDRNDRDRERGKENIRVLAGNIDSKIDALYAVIPLKTWMTKAQRAVLGKRINTVKSWETKQKIIWYRKAKVMKESFDKHIEDLRTSASAQCMRRFLNIEYTHTYVHQATQQQEEEALMPHPINPRPNQKQTVIEDWIRGSGHS